MKTRAITSETVHFGDDRDLVPPRYRNQIGRRYKSPHEKGHVNRLHIVFEFAKMLKEREEVLTREKLARMLTALDRGYSINAKRLSFDLYSARKKALAYHWQFSSHRVEVRDTDGTTTAYDSLRYAAQERGCSKEAARKWLKLDGKPNRRGEIWTYADPPHERSTVNARKKS